VKNIFRTSVLILLFFSGQALCPAFDGSVRPFSIIDVHEHIQDKSQAIKYNDAMAEMSIRSILLMGSPDQVLMEPENGLTGFTGFEKNNEELLAICKEAPGLYHAFASFSPDDPRMLEKLKSFLAKGGKGLKLYNGHYRFYDFFKIPLDAPHMMRVYAYCEKNRVPIVFHANARYYWPELKRVLDAYPELTVNLAHFCMALIDLDRIALILNTYPNVYTDISCGEGKLAYTTLEYISRYWKLYQGLIRTYKDRFLFATDMVLTEDPSKDAEYVTGVFSCYRDMLEKKRYTGILLDRYLAESRIEKTAQNSQFNGLSLDADTLRHIYEINPKRFLGLQ